MTKIELIKKIFNDLKKYTSTLENVVEYVAWDNIEDIFEDWKEKLEDKENE
jgi:hypothetical protein